LQNLIKVERPELLIEQYATDAPSGAISFLSSIFNQALISNFKGCVSFFQP